MWATCEPWRLSDQAVRVERQCSVRAPDRTSSGSLHQRRKPECLTKEEVARHRVLSRAEVSHGQLDGCLHQQRQTSKKQPKLALSIDDMKKRLRKLGFSLDEVSGLSRSIVLKLRSLETWKVTWRRVRGSMEMGCAKDLPLFSNPIDALDLTPRSANIIRNREGVKTETDIRSDLTPPHPPAEAPAQPHPPPLAATQLPM